MSMGRKTKLTPALQDRICDFIRKGNYVQVACAACGVSEAAYYDWLQRGDEQQSDGGGIYAEFLEAIKATEAEAETMLLSMVVDAAPKNWAAAMTVLERRHSAKWAQVRRGTLDVDITAKVINIADMARVYDQVETKEVPLLKEGTE